MKYICACPGLCRGTCPGAIAAKAKRQKDKRVVVAGYGLAQLIRNKGGVANG